MRSTTRGALLFIRRTSYEVVQTDLEDDWLGRWTAVGETTIWSRRARLGVDRPTSWRARGRVAAVKGMNG
jgi:hypothetical protein